MAKRAKIRPDVTHKGSRPLFDPVANGLIPLVTVHVQSDIDESPVFFIQFDEFWLTVDPKVLATLLLRAAAGHAAKYLGPERAIDIATGATVGRPAHTP